MRGRFSIEWLAQSSQRAEPGPWTGPAACGTHSESLPGFYCRTRTEEDPARQAHTEPRENQDHNTGAEVGFSSGTEEETSGYESEGGRSGVSAPQSPPAGRRPRTAFTAEQVRSLEAAFKRNAYLGTQDKARLCRTLDLSDKQIRNWFQNRRMKLKRMVQDALAQAGAASHYVGPFRPGPYPQYPPLPEGPYAPPLQLDYQYSSLPGLVLPTAAGSCPAFRTYY